MMTRKNHKAIAGALKAVRDSYAPHWNPNLFRACKDHAEQMAEVLRSDNPAQFNREEFLRAAGVPLT